MKIVFMGTPEFSVRVLEALAQTHEVICAYTQPPRPAGRGKKDRPSPVQASCHRIRPPRSRRFTSVIRLETAQSAALN